MPATLASRSAKICTQAYLPMVRRIAGRYRIVGRHLGLTLEDLVHEGVLGLSAASRRYDPAQGKFSTFAWFFVRGAITKALGRQDRLYALPAEDDGNPMDLESGAGSAVIHWQEREDARTLLRRLTARERKLVELRYGLCDGVPRSFEEVGAVVGISKQRVEQLLAGSLRRLRKQVPSKG